MKWHPEWWQEVRDAMLKTCATDPRFKASSLENIMGGLFEAGADAILTALRKMGRYHPPIKGLLDTEGNLVDLPGYREVTIPDQRNHVVLSLHWPGGDCDPHSNGCVLCGWVVPMAGGLHSGLGA